MYETISLACAHVHVFNRSRSVNSLSETNCVILYSVQSSQLVEYIPQNFTHILYIIYIL